MLQTTAQGSFSVKLSLSNHPPVKQAYSGEREYLFPHEVEELMTAARHVGERKKVGEISITTNFSQCDKPNGMASLRHP